MSASRKLVVFDALMLRSLILAETGEYEGFTNELAAFRVAFQRNRHLPIALTPGILFQYQIEANKFPPFNPLPRLNSLRHQRRAIFFEETVLNRPGLTLLGLPQEHAEFVLDALAVQASYLVTSRPAWLDLSEQTMNYGLQIVIPSMFAQL